MRADRSGTDGDTADCADREPYGDEEKFMQAMEAAARYASWLASYQSPKLSAVAIAQLSSQQDEHITYRVRVFSHDRQHIATYQDGVLIEDDSDGKLIEQEPAEEA